MCGIAGYFSKDKCGNGLQKIDAMIEIQNHRGPNDKGIFEIDFSAKKGMDISIEDREPYKDHIVDGYFGFCRLSIRDLSKNGHQPMTDKEKKIVIVFNGEIYNADMYRKELKAKGYRFQSTTDTEVILNLYKEYGFRHTIKILNGMFAIAVADLNEQKIYMARDRFGIKPLYYVFNSKTFMFASEMKCFLPLQEFDREIDILAIQESVICGNNYKNCLFKNVMELQPGEIFEWDIKNLPKIEKYFDISSMLHPKRAEKKYKQYHAELKELLKQVVKSQMVSDVNIACQLSGGIDSSIISIIASELEENKLQDSVSITFGDKYSSYSEEPYINIVNKRLMLQSHQSQLEKDFYIDNLKKAIWHLDTIPAFCNELGILKLAETISSYSTVLLSGEGADEIFGGYYKFIIGKFLDIYCKMPIKIFPKKIKSKYFMNERVKFENYIIGSYGGTIQEELAEKVFVNSEWKTVIHKRKKILEKLKGSAFELQQKYEILTRLPGLLNRQDKMTMAYSLENRVPFLDNEILMYSYSIPEKYLLGIEWRNIWKKGVSAFQGKYILKKISCDIFGGEFSYRKKMGFDIPIRDYLQEDKFKDCFYEEILPGIKERQILNADTIQKWYENIQQITEKELIVLWRSLLTELWCEVFENSDEKGENVLC